MFLIGLFASTFAAFPLFSATRINWHTPHCRPAGDGHKKVHISFFLEFPGEMAKRNSARIGNRKKSTDDLRRNGPRLHEPVFKFQDGELRGPHDTQHVQILY